MTAAASGSRYDPKQLEELSARIDKGFEKLERILSSIEERVRSLENREASCQPMVNSRLDLVTEKVAAHESEIQKLKELLSSLAHQVKIIAWIGSLIGSAVIIWLVGKLLGLI